MMEKIVDQLIAQLESMQFSSPVAYVYNPLDYARKPFDQYCRKYGSGPKEVVFLGMNPGPWGMAQTGVPFGDVTMVRGWLEVEDKVLPPPRQHPKRPVLGFHCTRGEVSGRRLWGWARDRFGSAQRFFERFWVANYCPLVFMEAGGRNRTPDKLKKDEKISLFEACDKALVQTVRLLKPKYIIGIGQFAYQRGLTALSGTDITIGRISHPSPANPKANKGWADLIEGELSELGLRI